MDIGSPGTTALPNRTSVTSLFPTFRSGSALRSALTATLAKDTTGTQTKSAVCTREAPLESPTAANSEGARVIADLELVANSLLLLTKNVHWAPDLLTQLLVQMASGPRGVPGVPAPQLVAEESKLAVALAKEGLGAVEITLSLDRATRSPALCLTATAMELSTKTWASVDAEPRTEEAGLFSAKTHWKSVINAARICATQTVNAQGTCWQQTPKGVNCFTILYEVRLGAAGKVIPLA